MVSVKDIESGGKEGRDAVQAALKELASIGYATMELARSEGGKLAGKTWVIHEEPINGFSVDRQEADGLKNRRTVFPTVGKSAPTNNDKGNNIERRESERAPAQAEPSPLKAEKHPTPQVPAAPPPRRAEDADAALELILAWKANGGGPTVQNWIEQAGYRESVYGPVKDEIQKFVGTYATSESLARRENFLRDPVQFFRDGFRAWLIKAKGYNTPKGAQPGAGRSALTPAGGDLDKYLQPQAF